MFILLLRIHTYIYVTYTIIPSDYCCFIWARENERYMSIYVRYTYIHALCPCSSIIIWHKSYILLLWYMTWYDLCSDLMTWKTWYTYMSTYYIYDIYMSIYIYHVHHSIVYILYIHAGYIFHHFHLIHINWFSSAITYIHIIIIPSFTHMFSILLQRLCYIYMFHHPYIVHYYYMALLWLCLLLLLLLAIIMHTYMSILLLLR